MTWDHFKRTVNVVTMAFEVEMRQNLTDGFVLFGILLQFWITDHFFKTIP